MATIAGRPTADDVALARRIVNAGEEPLVVLRPDDDTAAACRTNDLMAQAPLAVVLVPCLPLWCLDWKHVKESILTQLTIVSDKTLYRQMTKRSICGDEFIEAQMPLHQVNAASVATVSRCCSQETYLVLGVPPGSPMANAGGGGRLPADQARILVNSSGSDEVLKAISAARDGPAVVAQVMTRDGAEMGPTLQQQQQQSPAEKILEIKGLLDAGAITQAEYDAKKADLLHRL